MDAYRREFLQAFPGAVNLERALQDSSNRTPFFFFFRPSNIPDFRGSWLVLCRLGKGIESTFNIRSEVLILFTPYDDLQRRTFNALTQRARDAVASYQRKLFDSERFTPDPNLALLWSPDPAMHQKLQSWNSETIKSLVAPVPDLSQAPVQLQQSVRALLASVLSARDLYKGLTPVTGDDFVGRSEVLKRLSSELRTGLSLGLFGLRRSGKTSVVRELQRRALTSNLLVVLTDLESVADLSELPRQLSEDLTDDLRATREVDGNTWIGPSDTQSVDGFSELSTRLKRVADKNRHLSLVVAVDEVESLSQFVADDPSQVRTFLGSLRKASQATDNLSLLLTGITTKFFDDSMLAPNIDNPLFGFVEPVYLGNFSLEETKYLLQGMGRRMLLNWSDEAMQAVYRRTGGYPIFVRDLASAIRGRTIAAGYRDSEGFFTITEDIATSVSRSWGERASQRWSQIVRALKSHHPTMAEMLACDEQGLQEWLTIGAEADAAAKSLERLGLLDNSQIGLVRSSSLKALQSLGRPGETTVYELKEARDRTAWLLSKAAEEEGSQLEFKSSARWNMNTKQVDKVIESGIVKTVAAFLNSSGGLLLIGVSDAHDVIGIAEDLKIFGGSRDKYCNWLNGSLLGDRCGHDVVADRVRVELIESSEWVVAAVEVEAHIRPTWASMPDGSEAFYVRSGNRTQKLCGKEMVDYVNGHWP